MPKIALADELQEWESLLTAAEPYTEDFPELRERLAGLRVTLDRLRGLDDLKARLAAERQRATQELDEGREQGKEQVRQIRNFFKSSLGTKTKELTRFGIRVRKI